MSGQALTIDERIVCRGIEATIAVSMPAVPAEVRAAAAQAALDVIRESAGS